MDGRNDDDERGSRAEKLLYEAFRARAHSAIGGLATVPPMSAGLGPDVDGPQRNRLVLWAAPLAVTATIAVAVVVVIAVLRGTSTAGNGAVAGGTGHSTAPTAPAGSTPTGSTASGSTAPTGPVATVHVTSALNDAEVVGVGEPIVLNFSPTPTDSSAFTKAATVTVNGARATGAWYWERPYAGQPVQAHYRERTYWPANATIQVKLPIAGLSAGKGLAYSGALSSVTFRTGDAHISTVDAATLTMTVTDNGKVVNTVPVSLGAAKTPTYNGTKIVMQKGEDVPGTNTLRPQGTVMMSGPGYTNDPVPWSVRITASGEYVHAAGWNTHIGTGSTSNGCTNLKPADGKWFYEFSRLGDVVTYLHTDGTRMNPLDGLGDWNIPWSQWARGGLLITH